MFLLLETTSSIWLDYHFRVSTLAFSRVKKDQLIVLLTDQIGERKEKCPPSL